MDKEKFKEKNLADKKDFIARFRKAVDINLLKELYDFFKLEDNVLFSEEGLFVEKRIDNAEANLNHISPELYSMIQFAKNKYVENVRMVFNELINAPEEKITKKPKTYK